MSAPEGAPSGVDLASGIRLEEIPADGSPLLGHLGEESILLTRAGDVVRAIGATCTHYGGPLGEGLRVGDTVRCPWHHACFSLATGEALGAPALNPLPTWETRVEDGIVRLGAKREEAPLSARGRSAAGPHSVVVVGAGAAGGAAAEQLRREGYTGTVVLVDPDAEAPYDRPNLSKDYLAGSAPEEWIPLRPGGFYREQGIDRVVDAVVSIDRERHVVALASGGAIGYGALVLALGAVPRAISVPGADQQHVHVLRSFADCRAIIRDAASARTAVVVGAGFIGMEAAGSLRKRGLEVTVVEPAAVPFERVLGSELGGRIRSVHESEGVRFRMGRSLASIGADHVVLDDDSVVPADLVVIGVGVAPNTALAESAGLRVDNGIVVDEFLTTSDPHIYAAGDSARWPDPVSRRPIRVEHWVVAQRQGQAVARNIVGRKQPFRDVPFFWTAHFDTTVAYVGHAAQWDRVSASAGPKEGALAFRYLEGDRLLALATIADDRLSLETEVALAKNGRTRSLDSNESR